ncbi:hypothetical protein PM082_000806 [Marasmius tenuissimus]|nr:hypothetical protein PM082_000806 [Marasmius tenuissimus]
MTRASVSSSDVPLRRSRSHFLSDVRSEPRISRSSLIPSAVLPYLRRLDISDVNDMQPAHNDPLLTLTLSSPSFLDSTVQDSNSSFPLYKIKTEGAQTEVSRSDDWGTTSKTASIKWPKHLHKHSPKHKGKSKSFDDVQVQMRGGRWKSLDSFLPQSTPRKFAIPGYSHHLRWRAVGSAFWCVAASAKGPIAIFDPASDSRTPRLTVFETLHDKYDNRPMAVHSGVSLLLLDYLLITALFLATDQQEWMVIRKFEGDQEGESSTSPTSSRAPSTSTSAMQWRKILYGEPMYPKRMSTSTTTSSSNHQFPPPSTPTTAGQMAKIMFGKPLYPSLHPATGSSDSSFSFSDLDSDECTSESDVEFVTRDDDEEGLDLAGEGEEQLSRGRQERGEDGVNHQVFRPLQTESSQPPSPSAESVFYPLTSSTAPTHTYLDPLFYNNVPPVPRIPEQYRSAASSPIPSPIVQGQPSRRFRELPRPPASHRSQSTPRPRTADSTLSRSPSSPVTVSPISDYGNRRPSYDSSFLPPSTPLRTLPVPPPASPLEPRPGPAHGLRHSQSSGRPLNSRYRESGHSKRSSQYSYSTAPRTLPPTPTSTHHASARHYPKRSFGDFAEWLSLSSGGGHGGPHPSTSRDRDSILGVDSPPPAYNTIDFTSEPLVSSPAERLEPSATIASIAQQLQDTHTQTLHLPERPPPQDIPRSPTMTVMSSNASVWTTTA